MFSLISLIILLFVAAYLLLHFLCTGWPHRPTGPVKETRLRLGKWERLLLLGLAGSFGLLFLTGLAATVTGTRMSGYPLLLHCAGGGIFALLLLFAAFTWAGSCRFNRNDWTAIKLKGWWRPGPHIPAGRFDYQEKKCFWSLLLYGFISLVTMLLSMLPIPTTEALVAFHEIHRYAGLALTLVFMVFAYLNLLARPGGWRLFTTGRISKQQAAYYHQAWQQNQSSEK